ncbi:hypothetical protein HRbin30_03141 [bacterium HR30]|nr:hypothetical protein HRbin30_03141 [bacterium HR30]
MPFALIVLHFLSGMAAQKLHTGLSGHMEPADGFAGKEHWAMLAQFLGGTKDAHGASP